MGRDLPKYFLIWYYQVFRIQRKLDEKVLNVRERWELSGRSLVIPSTAIPLCTGC